MNATIFVKKFRLLVLASFVVVVVGCATATPTLEPTPTMSDPPYEPPKSAKDLAVIEECEEKTGVTISQDIVTYNRDIYYRHKVAEGVYSACLQLSLPSLCLENVSHSSKELLCDQVSDNHVRDRCIDHLLNDYPLEEILSYRGIGRIMTREVLVLEEDQLVPYKYDRRLVVRKGTLQYISGGKYNCQTGKRGEPYKKLSGDPRSLHVWNVPHVYIESCESVGNGMRIELLLFSPRSIWNRLPKGGPTASLICGLLTGTCRIASSRRATQPSLG